MSHCDVQVGVQPMKDMSQRFHSVPLKEGAKAHT